MLGCLPCADVEPGTTPTTGTIVRAAHHEGGTSQSGLDWCSPLCQCHCCAGFAMPPAPGLAFVARPVAPYSARCFSVPAVPAVQTRAPAAPWQPPQGA
ncbi:MAG: hypothetical protein EOO36_18890 [Cytophagaceae bacterium]|nr:MAG: hypothetical protein EOO36_18890 [Cytophagaceae bacterium]